MNRLFKNGAAFLLAAGTLLNLSGCKKDDNATTNTVNDILTNDAGFSTLRAAVAQAGWNDSLRNGNFTLFAPTDSAFRRAGITSVSGFSADSIRRILRYHLVSTRYAAADIPTASNTELTTLAGTRLYVTKNANGVYVNGYRVSRPDVTADNGIIHGIDGVLLAPRGNLSQLAVGDTSLSYFAAALARVGTSNSTLSGALTGTSPYTVFAPTNAAFRAAGYATAAGFQTADPAKLSSLLLYHVIPGRVFSPDFQAGSITTAGGGTLTGALSTGGSYSLTGAGNGNSAANVSAGGRLSTNGVSYTINRVLLSSGSGSGGL